MKRSATLVLLVFGVLLGGAWAQTESVLHTFCGQTDCADGSEPYAGLVFDQNGNLYGTTYSGGSGASSGCLSGRAGCGVVFKVTPEGRETVLYSFCAKNNCTDGELPLAGLVFDRKGNLYGTTDAGGPTDTASYSGSLQKARRQSSTASARRAAATAPMGGIPLQG